MTDKVRFENHFGKDILILDFSGGPAVLSQTMKEARKLIDQQPPRSLRIMTDAREGSWDTKVLAELKQFTKQDEPFVLASAVVGINGLKKILLIAVERFSGRTFQAFDTPEEAFEWLVKQ